METTRAAVWTYGWGGELRERADAGDAGEEGRLFAALSAGDREAAERLVERTYRTVFGLLPCTMQFAMFCMCK